MRQLKITKKEEPEALTAKGAEVDAKKRLNLLSAIEQIVELSEDSNLSDEFFREAKRPVAFVAKKLSLTPIQAVLFSLFVDKCDDQSIRIGELATHLKCRNVRIIRYMSDIDVLENRRLIRCSHRRNGVSYRVAMDVLEALKQNKAYASPSHKNISCTQLFTVLEELFEERSDDELTYNVLLAEIKTLLEDNRQLEFSRKIEGLELEDADFILLVVFCHLLVNKDDDCICYHDFESIYGSKHDYKDVVESLRGGWNLLLTLRLIEHTNSDGFADRETFKLSDAAKKDLLGELNIKQRQTDNNKGLLLHEKLSPKKLFYNEKEQKQVDRLVALLQQDNFRQVQQRLEASGMRRGFACLFYGSPGTGKTETVYQLAKLTGRNIMQVNISEIKSMWVGESEKNIKALFDRYRAYTENSEVTPIFLFNEADAIIGKRQVGAERAVDKMENSIQNIILQEMENLEGIMIATTNLTQNLDKAFERRFLYKIAFEKPGLKAKTAIWQTMIPSLGAADAGMLAEKYDFSGGQIENISRKQAVDLILSGKEAGLEALMEYCDCELIVKEEGRRKIGFL